VDSNTTNYTWTWGAPLPVVLKDDALNYVYGLGLILSTNGTAVQNYFMYDGLGSVTDVRDASGNAVDSYKYDAFGAIESQSGSSSNYWGFAGEQRDEESDFYYLRDRYFDPVIGRFLGQDKFGGGYPYAGNNPVNLTDPTGLVEMLACTLVPQYSSYVDEFGNVRETYWLKQECEYVDGGPEIYDKTAALNDALREIRERDEKQASLRDIASGLAKTIGEGVSEYRDFMVSDCYRTATIFVTEATASLVLARFGLSEPAAGTAVLAGLTAVQMRDACYR
jgi:RHS repeat-associated protein